MNEYDMMPHEQASTLMQVEPLIAAKKTETGVLVTKDGTAYVFDGNRHTVKINTEICDEAILSDEGDSVFTHNHPCIGRRCNSLSPPDIQSTIRFMLRETRVVCVEGDVMRVFRLRFRHSVNVRKNVSDYWKLMNMASVKPYTGPHAEVAWKTYSDNLRRIAKSDIGRKLKLMYGESALRHDVMLAFAKECGNGAFILSRLAARRGRRQPPCGEAT